MDDREKFRIEMKLKGEIAIRNVQKTVRQILENPKETEQVGKKDEQQNIR